MRSFRSGLEELGLASVPIVPMADARSASSGDDDPRADGTGKGTTIKDDLVGDRLGEPSASSAQQEGGLDSMFDRLELGEEDFDDLVIEEEDVNLEESTRWLAVARVNCLKRFSHEAFFQQMHNAWNSARQISIRAVAINRFVIQCFCLEDWEKVRARTMG